MGFDGVGDLLDAIVLPVEILQDAGRLFGGEAGSLRTLRGVLGNGDAIVQHDGGGQDVRVATLDRLDDEGVFPDAADMSEIVRAVVAVDGEGKEGSEERVVQTNI